MRQCAQGLVHCDDPESWDEEGDGREEGIGWEHLIFMAMIHM